MEGMLDLQHELREIPILLIGEDQDRKALLTRLLGVEKSIDTYRHNLIRTVLGNIPISFLSLKVVPEKSKTLLKSAIKDSLGIIVCLSSSSAKIRDYLKLVADMKAPGHSPPILLALFSQSQGNISGFGREYGPKIGDSPFSQVSITADSDLSELILTWIRINIVWHSDDDLVELLRVVVFGRDGKLLASLDMADVDWPIDLNYLQDSRFALILSADAMLLTLRRLGFQSILLASKWTNPDGLVILGESLMWEVAQAYDRGLEISPQTISDFLENSSHYRLSISTTQPSKISIHQTWASIKNVEIYKSIHEDLKSHGSLDVVRNLINVGRKLASKVPQEELNFLSGESFENALIHGWAPLKVVDGDIEVREGNSKEGRLCLCLATCPFGSATEGYLSSLGHKVPEWFQEITEQYKVAKDEYAVGPLCILHQAYRAFLFDKLVVSDTEVFYRQIACRGGPGMMAISPSSLKHINVEIDELMRSTHCAYVVFFGGRTPSDQGFQKQVSEDLTT